jgi:hypothetical protein
MKARPLTDRLARLMDDGFTLDRGRHTSFDAGHCATEAAAWLAGERHTDRPRCVSPVLALFLRTLNDGSREDRRKMLKPYIVRALETANDGRDEERVAMCRGWLVRLGLPPALELAGCFESAARLRGFGGSPALDDTAALLSEARSEVWGARDRAYRWVSNRRVAVHCAGAAEATHAPGVAAAAGVAFVGHANGGGYAFARYADAPDYADASMAAAATALATHSDAVAAAAYGDHGTFAPFEGTFNEVRERGRRMTEPKLRPLADALHREALELLDRMVR